MLQLSRVYGRSRMRRSVRRTATERPADGSARRSRREPAGDQDAAPGQAGDEHQHAVDDGGRDALRGAQAGGAERPRRHALARPPAGDVRAAPWPAAPAASAAAAAQRRGGAGGARGEQERGGVAGDDHRRRERDGRPRAAGEQPVADVAGRPRAASRAQREPPPRRSRAGRAARRRATAATSATATSGMYDRTGDGSASSTTTVEDDLHDLAGGPLPRRPPGRPRPTSPTSRPWLTARCTSPRTPPGSVALRNSDR